MKVKKLLKRTFYSQKIRIMEYGKTIEVEEGKEVYYREQLEAFAGILEMKVEMVCSNADNELVIYVELDGEFT